MPLKKNKWLYQSLRARLAATYVLVFGTTMILFSVMLYKVFDRNNDAEFDTALYNHAVDVANGIDVSFFGDVVVDPDQLSTGGKIFPFALGKSYLQILNIDGRLIAKSGALGNSKIPIRKSDVEAAAKQGVVFTTISSKDFIDSRHTSNYRLLTYLVQNRGHVRFFLQLAVPTTMIEKEGRGLLLFLLSSVPITLVVAAFAGMFLAGRALAPVAAIIKTVHGLNQNNLSERIPVPDVADEIRELSLTLNELLDRLQRAFESQERFVADASHELKTPLAILRGELDLMKSRERSPQEIMEFFSSASQELNLLSGMVENLLMLARVDAGAASLSVQKVRIDEIVLEIVARLERFAKTKGVKIRLDLAQLQDQTQSVEKPQNEFQVNGDPELLRCMLQNLVENAVKFSPLSTTVDVRIEDHADFCKFIVKDQGPGIAFDVQEKIFERFFRVKGTAHYTPGVGLGLAIAQRVAQAHGCRLEIESVEGQGACFYGSIKKF